MAKTINNFWGAETGGFEEASATNASPTIVSSPVRSGAYAYRVLQDQWIRFSPFESVANAGSGYVFGFAYRPSQTPSTTGVSWEVLHTGGTGIVMYAWHNATTNTYSVKNSAGTTQFTTTGALTSNVWNLVEIYFTVTGSNDTITVFINGVQAGTTSTASIGSTQPDTVGIVGFNSTLNGYYDDLYFMSGCANATDRLGDCEVYSYRSNLNSATPDYGDALNSGTWLGAQQVPFSNASQATYTDEGQGWITTNDVGGSAGTGGPNTDANLDGSLVAMKGVWRLSRGNGGSTNHYAFLGDAARGTNITRELVLGSSPANYMFVYQNLSYCGGPFYDYTTHGASGTFRGSITAHPSGTNIYLIADDDTLYDIPLSTAWDLSSKGTASTKALTNIAGIDRPQSRPCWSSDGLSLYVPTGSTGANTTGIAQYTTSTAYDISGLTHTRNVFLLDSTSAQMNQCGDIILVDSDTKAFHHWMFNGGGGQYREVYRYSLSSAKDLSTATRDQTLSITINGVAPEILISIQMTNDGKGLLVWVRMDAGLGLFDQTQTHGIHAIEYALSTAWDLSTATQICVTGYSASYSYLKDAFTPTSTGYFGSVWVQSGADAYKKHIQLSQQHWGYAVNGGIPLKTNYLSIGCTTTGARDIVCEDMLAQVLHVPSTTVPAPAFKGRLEPYRHLLVR